MKENPIAMSSDEDDKVRKIVQKANETMMRVILAHLGIGRPRKQKPLVNTDSKLIDDIPFEEIKNEPLNQSESNEIRKGQSETGFDSSCDKHTDNADQ